MKTPFAIGLVAASVAITVAIEESRIASLSASHKSAETTAVSSKEEAGAPVATVSQDAKTEEAPPLRTKNRPELKPETPAKAKSESEDESFEKTARRMWDNPAGKSMMNQGVKMAVGMMYQDFIDGLGFSKEEADYFKVLLGKEMSAQQELGMKMLGASAEERKALTDELAKRAKEGEEEIKKFLNSDEDFQKYTDYKNRLPEQQQLDGIRSAMTEKGAPLDKETETKLVDAMYRARTTASAPDLSGPGAMDALASGNIVELFEKNWDKQQEALRAETSGFLNETQMAALQEQQKQMKQMQLMGLKMAEKMMPGKKEEGK